jgi:hypothetical protein
MTSVYERMRCSPLHERPEAGGFNGDDILPMGPACDDGLVRNGFAGVAGERP